MATAGRDRARRRKSFCGGPAPRVRQSRRKITSRDGGMRSVPSPQFASDQMAKINGRRAPVPLSTAVSTQMKRMPSSSTGPEILIRGELHRRGLRFRVNHPRLPGRPDIAFTAARLAVFVDGCFWHSCPDHRVFPKNNSDWWRDKLERNVARDREKDAQLDLMGWIVVHVWEHEDPAAAADAIERLWRSRRQLAARRAGPRSQERAAASL